MGIGRKAICGLAFSLESWRGANFQEVYAAGERIAKLPPLQQYNPAEAALGHFGAYDYQRDKATNTFFKAYINACNYAIGVYLAGAGYGWGDSLVFALTYALGNSKNAFSYDARKWITKGWRDAHRGDWQ